MALSGFSELEMAINMRASSILLVWVLALGVLMWRRGRIPSDEASVQQPTGGRRPQSSNHQTLER
jgi:hypothetical protein